MKDENDIKTGELLPFPAIGGGGGEQRAHTATAGAAKGKHKRLPQQSTNDQPDGARPAEGGLPLGWGRSVISVSSVARDWGISSRRVRVMLQEGRLEGRQLENGYWEVYFPYRYVLGTRGPQLQRNRNLPKKSPYSRPKREQNPDQW